LVALNASKYVPYTGATGAVNLGAYDLTVNGITVGLGGGSVASNTAVGYQAINGTATGSYNVTVGYQTGKAITSATQNTFIGAQAGLSVTTGGNNTIVGLAAGYLLVSGTNNAFFGTGSGGANTASNNSFFGYNSGAANTTATNNTFIGYLSGSTNTTGSSNTFVGREAGKLNLSNGGNTFIGYVSGYTNTGSNNTFYGAISGYATTTGSSNVFLGYQTAQQQTTGSNNVLIGYNSGNTIADNATAMTIANNSILMGYNTHPLADNQTNQIVIGYNETGLGSNTTILGNSSTVTTAVRGRVTLGSTVDDGSNQLQVTGAIKTTSANFFGTGLNSLSTFGGDGSTNSAIFGRYANETVIGSSGTTLPVLVQSFTTKIGVNSATPYITFTSATTNVQQGYLYLSSSITAASAIARTQYINGTLVAAANSDVLVGLDINPTFTNGAFTGVSNMGLRVQNGFATFQKAIIVQSAPTSYDVVNATRLFLSTNGTNTYLQSYNNSTNAWGSANIQSNDLTFITLAGANAGKMFSNGNFAWGSTTDNGTDKLQVTGSSKFTGATSTVIGTSTQNTYLSTLDITQTGNISPGQAPTMGLSIQGTYTDINTGNNTIYKPFLQIIPTIDFNGTLGLSGSSRSCFILSPIYTAAGSRDIAVGTTLLNISPSFTARNITNLYGIYYNPTLTLSGTLTNHIAIQTVSGNNLFGTTSGSTGIGATTSIAASAILQVTSTTQGFLPPGMTTTQKNAISSPATGLMVYDTTLNKLCVYTGAAWETITSL
jgi:hypothetical protein